MDKNETYDIKQMFDLFNRFVNDLPSDCKQEFKDKIEAFNRNLNTIEAIDNHTIANIPWIEFDQLILDIRDELWDIWMKQDKDFMLTHYYGFYKLDHFISIIGIDRYQQKLAELEQYYDKLSADNKNKFKANNVHIQLLQVALVDFIKYTNEVSVNNESEIQEANIQKEEILSTLDSEILNYMVDQIIIYDEEGLVIDEYDDSKRKIN